MALTIKDIAKETGYAISTVSRALNDKPDVSEEAKRKIRAVVEARGFVPNSNAKQLKLQNTNGICLIVKGRSNLLFSSVVEQMQVRIEQAGYTLLLSYIDEDDNEMEDAARVSSGAKPLGLAFLGGNPDSFRKGFSNIKIPSVLITNSASALGFDNLSSVSVDDEAGAAMAIGHLLAKGHRNIGVLGGNPDTSITSHLRYGGCVQSFKNAGLPFDPALHFQKCRFSYQSAYKNFKRLYEKYPQMTALFAMGDIMAIGAIRAMRDLGLQVPGDLSVIGFDGTELAEYYNPKLTTVRQSYITLAERGVEILVERIRRGAPAAHEIVPCTLLEGESVRAV